MSYRPIADLWILARAKLRGGKKYYGCLDAGTRILTADLHWVRQDQVKVGDVLMGVDEFPFSTNLRRKLRESQVLSLSKVTLPSYRIDTEDGKSITASGEHPWLVANRDGRFPGGRGKSAAWVETNQLRKGDEIRQVVTPWDRSEIDGFESGYIAGILDGEGCADKSGFHVTISQRKGAVLDRVVEILSQWEFNVRVNTRAKNRNPVEDVYIGGSGESLRLLGSAPTQRLQRKWVGTSMPNINASSTIREITSVGTWPLIGMETSTGTFVADGLVSHNSYLGGFPERARALIGASINEPVLHVCGGMARHYPYRGGFGLLDATLDLDLATEPDILQDARGDIPKSLGLIPPWAGIIADPPYSAEDAAHYAPGSDAYPSPNKLIENCLAALEPGKKAGIIHYMVPKCPKNAKFTACVGVICGFNNRIRCFSTFERLS